MREGKRVTPEGDGCHRHGAGLPTGSAADSSHPSHAWSGQVRELGVIREDPSQLPDPSRG
ncbi:hypothetical protein SY2F82_43710 [Streptomyces sp. Y2F8-2]|nr:hypothetical protein SY2F82_43710 [Streptomyces sp. Y2F8-2]